MVVGFLLVLFVGFSLVLFVEFLQIVFVGFWPVLYVGVCWGLLESGLSFLKAQLGQFNKASEFPPASKVMPPSS